MAAVLGFAIDYLAPGASPGINLQQFVIIVGGLALFALGLFLRVAPRFAAEGWRKTLLIASLLSLATLLVLELLLAQSGMSTYNDIQNVANLRLSPYWTCDELGCHLVYEAVAEACENDVFPPRYCTVNRQGFLGPEDFVVGAMDANAERILALGDSFSFGMSSDFGESYVETLRAELPAAQIWNTGMPGVGTVQALALFEAFAPLLRPHLTILGFMINDFGDNLLALDSRWYFIDEQNQHIQIAKNYFDRWGNIQVLPEPATYDYLMERLPLPANEFEQTLGNTRLGTLLLRGLDMWAYNVTDFDREALSIQNTRATLRDLRDAASERGSALLILVIPHLEDITWPGKLYQVAIEQFEQLAIPYLEVTDLLHPEDDYGEWPDRHWNSSGHQKVGSLLSDCAAIFFRSGQLADCERVKTPGS